MFVQYFTHVPIDIGTAEKRIEEVRSSLDEWANLAYRDGEELRAKVGPALSGYAKTVRLEIDMPEIRSTGHVYPIRWTATGAEGLFPRLNADLILTHVGKAKTKLTLQGTYSPPLGPIGTVIDRTLLRNVAESTVQDWVDRVAEAVARPTHVS